MKRTIAQYSSSVLTKMAGFFVNTMSAGWIHMPEPPEELVTKKAE
jgi:cyclic lactone autoinducer peptide